MPGGGGARTEDDVGDVLMGFLACFMDPSTTGVPGVSFSTAQSGGVSGGLGRISSARVDSWRGGPACVDDPSAALEYGARLAGLANEVSEDLLIVMTTEINDTVTPTGSQWPGLLFDPAKDGSYKINAGIRSSRELLLQLTQLGLPTALEFRETITPI